jgi:hypothetical protein
MTRAARACVFGVVLALVAQPARADDVTDWNQTMLRAGLIAGSSPIVMSRVAALVHAAVFDAVNGINPRYTPVFVTPAGPGGASRRAAAVQAAYVILSRLYGATPANAQQVTFDARRTVSLAEIAEDDSTASIAAGIQWGQTVADAIWNWRSGDGFSVTAPFPDSTAIGEWRRTPNLPVSATLSPPGAGYLQFSAQTPWVMTSPMQFRPGPPPLVTSVQYARDYNEVKTMGSFSSAARTPEQTTYSLFWNSGTATYLWNNVAVSLLADDHRDRDGDDRRDHGRRGSSLLEHARVLGLLNIAMADAAIACWDAKYQYRYWRPITAIRETADDGNAATSPDASWMPLFATPGHPEYPSGHSCVSGAAATVLGEEFGKWRRFTMASDLMLGVARSFRGFGEALEEVKNARIFAGIHFRTATDVGSTLGATVGTFVMSERFQRIR